MAFAEKSQEAGFQVEISSQHDQSQDAPQKSGKMFESAQLALHCLGLLCGFVVLGTSASTASVFNSTNLSSDFDLPLWPEDFDMRPTNALIAGGVLVVLSNLVALVFAHIRMLRDKRTVHCLVDVAAPTIGFVSIFVAIVLFYAVNASTTTDTIQSWSCQWDFTTMNVKPYFSSVCKESKTALYLSIILIPVELAAVALATRRLLLHKKSQLNQKASRSSSPSIA
ncbi:hypothetical protein Micbo1qcDRAFT_230306 [Microdochium bolleyi]|uniref:Uncharacterized protein n=1 Tax=Microdochium bolleyi TaxID=196109 RepID=A0A136JKS0_9PEZI|nr:hypothetical protein Micbo1qcDRAFT_230306 [Microdochium bolleyi]